jgi:hypothetical protein
MNTSFSSSGSLIVVESVILFATCVAADDRVIWSYACRLGFRYSWVIGNVGWVTGLFKYSFISSLVTLWNFSCAGMIFLFEASLMTISLLWFATEVILWSGRVCRLYLILSYLITNCEFYTILYVLVVERSKRSKTLSRYIVYSFICYETWEQIRAVTFKTVLIAINLA